MVLAQGGPVLYVSTKFEADSSFRLKVIRVPKCQIGSHDPGHAHLGVVLYSIRWRGPSSHLCTKFEADCSFHSKLLMGSRN